MYKQPKSRDHNASSPHGGEDEVAMKAFEAYKGGGMEGEDAPSVEKLYEGSHEATGACGQVGADGYEHSKE